MTKNEDYIIIDEPKVRFLENMIINPVIILFAAMVIPIFVNIPFYGRWWLPFVWLIFNGVILGSPSIKKEIFYSVLGFFLLVILFYATLYFYNRHAPFNYSFIDYMVIIANGLFFGFLYLVVFSQNAPYQIYQYVKGEAI
jgi:hypothetical protein